MVFFFLDASGLVKRYALEFGTPTVNYLFTRVPLDQFVLLNVGIAETVSILVRKKNGRRLSAPLYMQAMNDLRSEITNRGLVHIQAFDSNLVRAALPLIEIHSINSNDAILLRSALDLRDVHHQRGDKLVLVSSDQLLLRAAQVEGFLTFNPKTQLPSELDALIGS